MMPRPDRWDGLQPVMVDGLQPVMVEGKLNVTKAVPAGTGTKVGTKASLGETCSFIRLDAEILLNLKLEVP